MANIIQEMLEDKKEYRMQMKKAESLPEDYRFVFQKIQTYIWSFTDGNGRDMLKTQNDLIELFESSAAQGQHVLDVTGEDVAGFCDELIRGNKLWTDRFKNKFNRNLKSE